MGQKQDIKRSRAVELGRHISPPAHLTAKMKPFNFAIHDGIKHKHMWAFSYVCHKQDVIILVRATNPKSVLKMDINGYQAKPVDCKPKTADLDVFIGNRLVECAGLVGCPELLTLRAYKSDKFEDVLQAWNDFKSQSLIKCLKSGVKVYLRSDSAGFYAIDDDPSSKHYGCLLLSKQMPPDDFDLSKRHSRNWKEKNMAYIHGDYDLYGIIDLSANAKLNPGEVHRLDVTNQKTLGQDNFVTDHSGKVMFDINLLLGTDMIKHGEQSAWKHKSDKEGIYIFYPDNSVYVVKEKKAKFSRATEMKSYLDDLYRYIFSTTYDR